MAINSEYKKFDIWLADLSGVVGSEQGGNCRPVLVVSNNIGNSFSPVVIIAVLSSKMNKPSLPTHVFLDADLNALDRDSIVMLEQLRTVDKNRLYQKVGTLHNSLHKEVNNAASLSLDTEDQLNYVAKHSTNFCFV